MRKVKMSVQGHVQSVGFRCMTKMAVDQLGVTGVVKNEDDGSVIIGAIGGGDIIQKFIEEVKKSPSPSGRVQYASVQEDPMIEGQKKSDVVG